jgi:hypothetical protein
MNWLGQSLGVASAAIFLVAGGAVQADEADARLAKEAKALFRVILLKEQGWRRCGFAMTWLSYPIPAQIARRHFGLTLHAELSAPDPGINPPDILDPENKNAEAFCGLDEQKKADDEGRKAVEGGADTSPGRSVVDYAFPIFDMNFRKAVVIEEHALTAGWRQTASGVKQTHGGVGIDAVVFAKVRGIWRETARETLGTT